MDRHTLIGVIGAGNCDEETYRIAEAVGRGLATRGFGIVCGGLGGVMEAACKGAVEAGGLTVGILPGEDRQSANEHVQLRIATGMGVSRNVIIVRSAKAVIAVDGGPGTLSELAYCLQLGVPAVSLGSFDVSSDITQVSTAEEAVAAAIRLAESV